MRSTGLGEAQAGIKIARRNINNLRYADDTILMAESEEEPKSLLMQVNKGFFCVYGDYHMVFIFYFFSMVYHIDKIWIFYFLSSTFKSKIHVQKFCGLRKRSGFTFSICISSCKAKFIEKPLCCHLCQKQISKLVWLCF